MQNTLAPAPLTAEQIAHYHEEGYVMLGRVLDDAALQALRAEELRFRTDPAPAPTELTIFRSQMCHYSQAVRRVCTQGAQIPLARQLVGDNVCYWYNQFVTKLPDAASGKSEFPWHQDNSYINIAPATNVTIWVALDDVDEENGCVWVMPRTHLDGLLDHTPKADTWHHEVLTQGDGVPAVLKAGEAVAFTALTLHRSKLNHTQEPRRGFFMGYADANATIEVLGTDKMPRPIVESHQTWMVSGALQWPPQTPLSLT